MVLRFVAWTLCGTLSAALVVVILLWSLIEQPPSDMTRGLTVAVSILAVTIVLSLPWLWGRPRGEAWWARAARSALRITRALSIVPVGILLSFVVSRLPVVDATNPIGVHVNAIFGSFPQLLPPFFIPCAADEDIVCRSVTVPIDPLAEALGTTRIAIAMLPATEASTKKGTLFLHGGGPMAWLDEGESRRLSGLLGYVRESTGGLYDIVTFDPRGLGWSTSDSWCHVCSRQNESIWSPCFHESDLEIRQNIATCIAENAVLRTIDEHRFADDLEVVRDELSLDEVSFVGISWGARLALAYTMRFPHRVKALVLESPARYGQMWEALEPKDTSTITREQLLALPDDEIRPLARSMRDAFGVLGFGTDAFLRGALQIAAVCLAWDECAIRPRPLERILVVEERLRNEPVLRQKTKVHATAFRAELHHVIFAHEQHLEFLDNVARIEQRKTYQVRHTYERKTRSVDDPERQRQDMVFTRALACRSDHFKYFLGRELSRDTCGDVVPVHDEPLTHIGDRALIAEGNWDARTPPALARSLARSIGAPLVLASGVPHGAVLAQPCVRAHVTALLNDGVVPAGDVDCQ
jgi:pimeloyl-ACP methyl ester carboxylesterase